MSKNTEYKEWVEQYLGDIDKAGVGNLMALRAWQHKELENDKLVKELKKLKQEKEDFAFEAIAEARNIRDAAQDDKIKSRLSCFVGKMEFWK